MERSAKKSSDAPCGRKTDTHVPVRVGDEHVSLKTQNVQYLRRTANEVPPASRPCRRQAHRCRAEVCRRHHHSRYRPREAVEGEIIAVGPGGRDEAGKLIPIDLKVGDTVLFGKWSGTEVKIDGQDLLIMKESDIMGVIEGAAGGQEEGRLSHLTFNRRKISNGC